jgi:hypothetical protein
VTPDSYLIIGGDIPLSSSPTGQMTADLALAVDAARALKDYTVTDSDVITRMLHAIDRLDWATVRDSLTDVIVTDYTSLWGGEPETLAAEELISRWSAFASGLAATQHQTGPVVVTDGRAATHVVAYHWMPDGDLWTVHGHYVARITEGRIAELTLQTFYAGGSEALPAIAARRPAMA